MTWRPRGSDRAGIQKLRFRTVDLGRRAGKAARGKGWKPEETSPNNGLKLEEPSAESGRGPPLQNTDWHLQGMGITMGAAGGRLSSP